MYEYLEGVLQAILPDAAVIDVGGVGYRVAVAKSSPLRCSPAGRRVKVYVDLVIREDAHTLFGFASVEDRDFFRLLQQVSGIGPKTALSILGHAPAAELAAMLFRKDTKALSAIPGIGRKLAERLSVELQEKIADHISSAPTASVTCDAIRALQTLGFSAAEARTAISSAQGESPHLTSVEQIVQYALSMKR